MKFLAVLSRFLKFKRKNDEQGEPAQSEIEQSEPEQGETGGKTAQSAPKKRRLKIIITSVTAVILVGAGLSTWSFFSNEDVQSVRMYSEEAWAPLSGADMNLFEAVRSGDIDEVRRCLSEGGNHHAVGKSSVTPVKAAIALGRADMVREFVAAESGASAVYGVAGGWNALLVYAVVQNRPQAVKEIVKLPLALNASDKNGYTPLLYAIDRNNVDAARELLSAGADPNARGKEGVTPLIAAVTRGNHNMVAELLSAGADWKIASPSGETAIGIARQRKRDAIVALLISAETPPRDTYNEYMKLPIESGDISI